MRKITDMTRDEIVALTEADLQRLMNYECAENGVALLSLPEKPVEEQFEKDLKYYEVGDMCFLSLADAERVADVLKVIQIFKDDYDYAVGYDAHYLNPKSEKFDIVAKYCYSTERFNQLRVRLAAQKQAQEQYEKDLKAYQKMETKWKDTCVYIIEAYQTAAQEVRNEEQLRNKFAQYLELAEGNREVAMRFLEKVEKVPDELAQELVHGFVVVDEKEQS